MKRTMTEQERLITGYLARPWTVRIKKNSWGRYLARVDELDGCVGDGETAEEALASVHASMHIWFATALLKGLEIPEPGEDVTFSGKFVVRVPTSLHRKLATQAKEEGVSLNTLIVTLLSGEVGKADIVKQVRSCLEQAVQPAHETFSIGEMLSPKNLLRTTTLSGADGVMESRRIPWENKQKAWNQN